MARSLGNAVESGLSTNKEVQALADRRFEDADGFHDDFFEPRRAKEGISNGRVESYVVFADLLRV
jgi:hypothetical protein